MKFTYVLAILSKLCIRMIETAHNYATIISNKFKFVTQLVFDSFTVLYLFFKALLGKAKRFRTCF